MRLLILCAVVVLASQSTAPALVETPHLTIAPAPALANVSPGSRLELMIEVTPKPKMHVYSPQQKDYIPISLSLAPSPAFTAHPPAYPQPEKYFFAPLKETQLVYTRAFRITQPVTIASAAALRAAGLRQDAGVTITGKVRYQACDDAICYMPKEVPVSWRVALGEKRLPSERGAKPRS